MNERKAIEPLRIGSVLCSSITVIGLFVLGVLPSNSRPASGAFPGANGKVAFTRFPREGNPQIFVVNPRGGRVTQLLRHSGEDGEPAWSPDGLEIAFTSVTSDGKQGIFVARPGRALRRLTSHYYDPAAPVLDAHPRWSSDGQRIVFHRFRDPGRFELYVMDAHGRPRPRRLSRGFEPEWSPTARRIVFADRASESDDFDLYVLDVDSRAKSRLTTNPESETEPSWSPDGRRIAFVRQHSPQNSEIYVMSADGTRQRRLTNNPHADVSPTWSPDGKMIAFASRRTTHHWGIWVMNAKGSGERRLTQSSVDDTQPAWRRMPLRSR